MIWITKNSFVCLTKLGYIDRVIDLFPNVESIHDLYGSDNNEMCFYLMESYKLAYACLKVKKR